MKRRLSFILTAMFLLPLLSLSQNAQSTFEISGTIRGLKNDSVVLLVEKYAPDGKRIGFDTLITDAANGYFTLKGMVSKPELTQMQFGGKAALVVVERGKIVMNGNIDSLNYITITGTPTNNELTEAQLYFAPLYESRTTLSQQLRKLQEGTQEFERIARERRKKTDSINSYKLNFMQTHPASELSLSYLYVLQDELTTGQVEQIFNSFPPGLKNSSTGKYIYSKLQANKLVAVGNKAPDFISTDMNGKKVKLSDYKGKYILLEFWASWCVPCRAQSPHLAKFYQEYKDKGFTILQYSLDVKKDEQKWRDAITKDGLVWTQISNLSGPSDPVSKIYGVQPIPDNFLISPEGVILGRRLNPKELEEFLIKTL